MQSIKESSEHFSKKISEKYNARTIFQAISIGSQFQISFIESIQYRYLHHENCLYLWITNGGYSVITKMDEWCIFGKLLLKRLQISDGSFWIDSVQKLRGLKVQKSLSVWESIGVWNVGSPDDALPVQILDHKNSY